MAQMLLSMTGYGEAQEEIGPYAVMVTVRSVNSRYLDFRFKAPSICSSLEPLVRQLTKKILARGKVDLTLSLTRNSDADEMPVQADVGLARAYKKVFLQLQQALELKTAVIPLSLIISQPDVLVRENFAAGEVNKYKNLYLQVVKKALQSLKSMQEMEGEALQADLLGRCRKLEALIEEISHQVRGLPELIRDKLVERIKGLLAGLAPIDDPRVYQEAAQIAERADITEELVRFKSHCRQFMLTIEEQDGSRGKKLDFIIQELLREINTIGSKAAALPVLQLVVQVKDELEKLREQVQNVA